MSGLLISPTDIVKGVRLLRNSVRATRTDEAGSIARFNEAEHQLSRFKAAISNYRKATIPPEIDEALAACEDAIMALDKKLEKFRETFKGQEVKSRRLKAMDAKVKFASVIGGLLGDFDAKIARELRTLELWERVHAAEQRNSEIMQSTQLKSIELKLDELKQYISIERISRRTKSNGSNWSDSDVTWVESEEEHTELKAGQMVMSRSESVMQIIRNERLRKPEQYVEKRYSNNHSCHHGGNLDVQSKNYELHCHLGTDTSGNTDLGSQVGTALGYIVKGVIGLLDTCVYRPRFSLWNSSVDWKQFENAGIYLDPARPYRNKSTSVNGIKYALASHFQNPASSTICVILSPPTLDTQNPENDERQWASLQAYSHCRDLNGIWVVDTQYANLKFTPNWKSAGIRTLRVNGMMADPFHMGHIEVNFSIDWTTRVRLKVKGLDYMERYTSCLSTLDDLRHKGDLPGHWPNSSNHPLISVDTGQLDEMSLPKATKVSKGGILDHMDPENGPWVSEETFLGDFFYRQRQLVKSNSEPNVTRYHEYGYFIHSAQDVLRITHHKESSNYTLHDIENSVYYVRYYDSDGIPAASILNTLFSIFRCEWIWDQSVRAYKVAGNEDEVVAFRHSWDEKPIALVDDLPNSIKGLLGVC